MTKLVSLIGAAGLGALAMTASGIAGDAKDNKTEESADPRIGEKVNRICFQNSISGWRAVKGEDDVVLLRRSVRDWYRVELLGACDYRLFRSALSIGIESRPAGSCVSRGDVIIVEDTPGFHRRCTITAMYEWDEDAQAEESETAAEDSEGY